MSRRYRSALAVAVLLVLAGVSPLRAAPTEVETTLRCLRDNLPQRWSLDAEVRHLPPGGLASTRRLLYASRPYGRGEGAEHWVRFIEPPDLRDLAHLYRPQRPGWERYSFLPTLGRVVRTNLSDPRAGGLDEIAGLDGLDALLRWPAQAVLALGETAERQGLRLRAFRATRRVGSGAEARVERLEGWLDPQRCLPLEARFEGATTGPRAVVVDPAGIVQRGAHWLPLRLRIDGQRGEETRVQLRAVRVDPPFARQVFDTRQFHRTGAAEIGLSP